MSGYWGSLARAVGLDEPADDDHLAHPREPLPFELDATGEDEASAEVELPHVDAPDQDIALTRQPEGGPVPFPADAADGLAGAAEEPALERMLNHPGMATETALPRHPAEKASPDETQRARLISIVDERGEEEPARPKPVPIADAPVSFAETVHPETPPPPGPARTDIVEPSTIVTVVAAPTPDAAGTTVEPARARAEPVAVVGVPDVRAIADTNASARKIGRAHV